MIIQTLNVVAGFALSGSILGGIQGLKEPIAKSEHALGPYKQTLGVVVFLLGLLQLADRLGAVYVSFLGGGYPQALLAIAMGLLLAGSKLSKIPGAKWLHDFLWPYRQVVGIIGLVVGLSALL